MAQKPRQVALAARKAEELMQGQGETPAPPTPPAQEPQQDAQPRQEPQQQAQPQQPQQPQQAQQPPQQPPQQAQRPQGDVGEMMPASEWEQRYKTLQGMHRRTVDDFQSQVRDLSERLEALQEQQEKAERQPAGATPLVTPQEIEDYGEDLINLTRKLARDEAGRLIAEQLKPVQKRTEELSSRVKSVSEQTAQERVVAALDHSVPDWRQINSSQAFKDWCLEQDPLSGAMRQTLLMNAFNAGDGQRVVRFFQTWQNGQGHAQPQPQAQPQQQQPASESPPQQPQRHDLTRYAGPPANGAGSQSVQQPAPQSTWTRAQVEAFYNDVTRGKFKNDPETKAAIEADLNHALRSGRVIA